MSKDRVIPAPKLRAWVDRAADASQRMKRKRYMYGYMFGASFAMMADWAAQYQLGQ